MNEFPGSIDFKSLWNSVTRFLCTTSPQILQRHRGSIFASVIKCAGTAWEQNFVFLCITRNILLPNIKLVLQERSDRQRVLRAEGTFIIQPWIASTKPNSPKMLHFRSSASPSTSPCTYCNSHLPSPFTTLRESRREPFPTGLANLESMGFIDAKDRGISGS